MATSLSALKEMEREKSYICRREREGSLIRNFMQDLHLTVGDSSLTRKNDEKKGGASGLRSHFLS